MRHPLAAVLLAAIVLPTVAAQDDDLDVFFSPDGRVLPTISGEILAARKTIDIAMYSMSIESIWAPRPAEPALEGKDEEERVELVKEYEEALEKYERYRERVAEGKLSIFDALRQATERGVKVRMVFNQGHRGQWKTFQSDQLTQIGVELRYTTRTMHEKFGIFDGKVLITGSANWSQTGALVYDEVTFVFRDHPAVVDRFETEFDELWQRSKPYPPAEDD